MSSEHRLEALRGDNPMGFLAAVGALALLSQGQKDEPPRLAWEPLPPHPALLTAAASTTAALAKELFAALTAPEAPSLREAVGKRKLKELTTAEYRQRMRQLDGFRAGLLAGMCSDVTARENPERGPLVMTSGPQDFPKIIEDTVATVKKAGALCVATALFGPWDYVAGHPLGFDPAMERRHAYLAEKPKRDAEHVPGALLLAVSALVLLPLFPCSSPERFSNAVFKGCGWDSMVWPLWKQPVPLPVVGSLLTAFSSDKNTAPGRFVAAYQSERSGIKREGRTYYHVLRAGRRFW
jgi:hypothetical protein